MIYDDNFNQFKLISLSATLDNILHSLLFSLILSNCLKSRKSF